MAASSWLTQYQSIKSTSECLIVAIEDVSDLWPSVKDAFEARIPLRKACLNNKAHSPVSIDKLPLEFVLTTDLRLRARFPLEQSPFVFRLPFATILLLTCEDLDDYKTILKPRIKLMVSDDREWFIIFVTKPNPQDPTGKQAKRVFSKLEVDFSSKRRERCCKFDLASPDAVSWEEVESRLSECIRITLDRRIQFYDEEAKRLTEKPGFNFCNLLLVKESLAFMFELARLYEDALREYDELEQIYLELVNAPSTKLKEFGGVDAGDDRSALLDCSRKPITQFSFEDSFREFDFRQYLFAHQASLLLRMNRPIDVAGRGLFFIHSFSKLLSLHQRKLPFCMREVWVITACLSLTEGTTERFTPRSVNPDAERDFYRLQADLSSLARTKLMRLADLVGYGLLLERSPCNSAVLSMSPWPKPSVWPSVPSDAGARILAKEEDFQKNFKALNASASRLPLAPTLLLREANRRRASLSVGSVSELSENRPGAEVPFSPGPVSPGPDSPQPSSTVQMQRTQSASARSGNSSPILSPTLSRSGFDKPMKLPEVYAAAEHEILKLVTHEGLKKALSSIEEYEEFYLLLTREAADNYHRSRKRHGVVLDGELAAVHHRKGNYDSAAKLYEKVCALYSGERWDGLLAEVLPRLAECQNQLGEHGGFLTSCIKLLSLNKGLLLVDARKLWQQDFVKLAHSGLKVSVAVDVSALITFSGQPGPPMELCEGDPGSMTVTVWSGFPEEISLESLSMALTPTFSTDEGAKVIKSGQSPVLQPGKNAIVMQLQPQRPGSYVLGAFTGQLGQVKLRSHTYCTISAISSKLGSPESDDYLSADRPLRPVLQVSAPRQLVEIKAVVSGGLLVGEPQWLGLVIRPIDYSLKGALIHISAAQNIVLCGPQLCELQLYNKVAWAVDSAGHGKRILSDKTKLENGIIAPEDINIIELKNGTVELPEWASDAVSVMWLQALAKRTPTDAQCLDDNGTLNLDSPVNLAARSINIKLDFGLTRNRVYERTIAVKFTEAFRAATHVVTRGNDGTLLLQVTLLSQIVAGVTIVDATLQLQTGFSHAQGQPDALCLLPLSMSGNSECALLFVVNTDSDSANLPNGNCSDLEESVLIIRYRISGNRATGAHPPSNGHETLVFKSSFELQIPVLDRLVSVGMLPVPCSCPRVGQQVILQWRIERLRRGVASSSVDGSAVEVEQLPYEIKATPEAWMVAGKKKSYVSLSTLPGARATVSMACIPLVAGHVHPPSLELSFISQAHISHSPPGPHLVCIFPPAPCSAFCLTSEASR